jgi:Cft2 family RNA processing exonuclease
VQLAGTVVWCDARRSSDLCFLSHAARPTQRSAQGKLLATATTVALCDARGGKPKGELLVTPLRRPFFLGAARLELFPSGRMPGAASLRVEIGERAVVYAGEICPGAGLAEPMEVRGAEALVVDAPLAALPGKLPPVEEARAALIAAVQQTLAEGRTPIVLGTIYGTAEEAIAALAGAKIPVRAHPKLIESAAAYAAQGLPLPSLKKVSRSSKGEAIVWPLEQRGAQALAAIGNARRIAATGLALDPDAARKLEVDQVIPLSEGADLAQVVDYAAHTEARAVYFTRGYSDRAADLLVERKVKQILALGPPAQMDLFR